MTYNKPYGVKYVDMCMYIDNNIYCETFDENLVFEYLYLIVVMLAAKEHYFKNDKDYDDFGIFCATKLYFRLTNPKQFQIDDKGEPLLNPINNILDYIKSMLFRYLSDFVRSEYYTGTSFKVTEDNLHYGFNNILIQSTTSIDNIDFNITLSDISSICRKFLDTIPYPRNSVIWINIYVSVLLTFLDSVTLNKWQVGILKHLRGSGNYSDDKLWEMYDENRIVEPTLFHLPQTMSNYISVLSRQLRSVISDRLSEILHTKISNDFILVTALQNEIIGVFNDNKRTAE